MENKFKGVCTSPHDAPFPGVVLSTGTEDFFDSAYYFDGGPFRFPVSGLTHLDQQPGQPTPRCWQCGGVQCGKSSLGDAVHYYTIGVFHLLKKRVDLTRRRDAVIILGWRLIAGWVGAVVTG